MKKSTFSSIKARLRDNNYFRKIYIPNFPLIGFELMMIMYGQLNRYSTYEERMRVAGDLIKSFDEDFLVISESNVAINLSVSKNYTEYMKNQERFFQVYSENKFLTREGMTNSAFPFEISITRSFLDFEALLAKLFNFPMEDYPQNAIFHSPLKKRLRLSKAEKKVLAGLVLYAEGSDTYIADQIGVSRNTVANAKKKFIKQNICFPQVIPDLRKLGMKILVFSHRVFNPKTTTTQRHDAANVVRKNLAPFLYLSKDLDGFTMSAHASFEDYNNANEEVMTFYTKNDFVLDEPTSYHISIPNMHFLKDYDFIPITFKMLGFDLDTPLSDQ